MLWLARSLRRSLGTGVQVRCVRYRLRGWNDAGLDALRDAEAALASMRRTVEPDKLVLVGHSMGARVAAHLSATGGVSGVVALAPWWPRADADLVPTSSRLLVLHGTDDTWTDPQSSLAQTRQAKARGVNAEWLGIEGGDHYLLRDWRQWHRLTAEFVAEQLGDAAPGP